MQNCHEKKMMPLPEAPMDHIRDATEMVEDYSIERLNDLYEAMLKPWKIEFHKKE
jgi:hypothetical protein